MTTEEQNKSIQPIDKPVGQPMLLIQEVQGENETIKIGEIVISSKQFNVYQLGDLLLQLLEKPEVKQYLQIVIKRKKKSGDYLG